MRTQEQQELAYHKNKDGTLNVNFTEQGKLEFGQIQTSESLKGNLASTQKQTVKVILLKPKWSTYDSRPYT